VFLEGRQCLARCLDQHLLLRGRIRSRLGKIGGGLGPDPDVDRPQYRQGQHGRESSKTSHGADSPRFWSTVFGPYGYSLGERLSRSVCQAAPRRATALLIGPTSKVYLLPIGWPLINNQAAGRDCLLSTNSVNCRGPRSMPRAEPGIHGLRAGAATGLEKSEKRGVQAARLPPEPGGTGSKLSYRSYQAQRSG